MVAVALRSPSQSRRAHSVGLAVLLQALPLLTAVPLTLLANLPDPLIYSGSRYFMNSSQNLVLLDTPPPPTPLAVGLAWSAVPLLCGWGAGYLYLGARRRYLLAWLALAALLALPWAAARLWAAPLSRFFVFTLGHFLGFALVADAWRLANAPPGPPTHLGVRTLEWLALPLGPALMLWLLVGIGIWYVPTHQERLRGSEQARLGRPDPCPFVIPVPVLHASLGAQLRYCSKPDSG